MPSHAALSSRRFRNLHRMAIFLVSVVSFLATATAATADTADPFVDFSKPLFVKKGFPACPTADAVNAIFKALLAGRSYLPKECGLIKQDVAVIVLENAGMAGPYRVRLLNTRGDAEAWVPYSTLRN